jgi:hypothetical protein
MKLITLILNIFSKRKNSLNESVLFDTIGVTRTMPDGRTESILWDELQEVNIVTTDEGPAVDDVFWVLSGNGKGCAVPSGFNNAAVIQAMGSTQNAKFVCWKR